MENHVQGIINDLAQKKADFDMSLNPLCRLCCLRIYYTQLSNWYSMMNNCLSPVRFAFRRMITALWSAFPLGSLSLWTS